MAVDEAGFVWAWGGGDDVLGQLGDGTYEERSRPVRSVAGEMTDSNSGYLEDIVKVTAGRTGLYSMGLDNSGRVWAWGDGLSGQLGAGQEYDGGNALSPVRVHGGDQNDWSGDANLINVIDIDAGVQHSIACDSNGDVYCWGFDHYSGQLGNGAGWVNSCEPGRVLGVGGQDYLTGIVDVAVSCGSDDGYYGSSFALDVNGHVFSWGSNGNGQLGNNNIRHDEDAPVEVNTPDGTGALDDIVAISAGDYHVLALDANGCVWAWGYDDFGQLGNGPGTDKQPTPVGVHTDANTALTDIIYIDAGFNHSMAIDKYGTTWVWGRNNYGQLGLGDKGEAAKRVYATRMLQQ